MVEESLLESLVFWCAWMCKWVVLKSMGGVCLQWIVKGLEYVRQASMVEAKPRKKWLAWEMGER